MALRAVPDHPKFADLKMRLKQPKGVVVGWLEMMWHFSARFTPQGNIGKYSDTAIEAWLEWNGEPGALIAALADTGWLDRSEAFRLIIHDWHEHADDYVNTELARKCLTFANGKLPRTGRLNKPERERFNAAFPDREIRHQSDSLDGLSGYTQTKSASATKPEPCLAGALPDPEPVKATPRPASFVPPEWVPADSWLAFVEMRKKIRAPLTGKACVETVRELEKLRKRGHDPGEVLNQSVQRSWRGVFEIKQGGANGINQGNRAQERTNANRTAAEAALGEMYGSPDGSG